MSSNRYGESKTAYREVQERHEEIKKIEQTLTELAQLFNDVSFQPCFYAWSCNNIIYRCPYSSSNKTR
jgi:hypothetical protein